jgi:hypothetical protein
MGASGYPAVDLREKIAQHCFDAADPAFAVGRTGDFSTDETLHLGSDQDTR